MRSRLRNEDLTSPPAAPLALRAAALELRRGLLRLPVPLLAKERLGEVLSLGQNYGFHDGLGLTLIVERPVVVDIHHFILTGF